jgi:hypothetical protein
MNLISISGKTIKSIAQTASAALEKIEVGIGKKIQIK